MGFRLKHVESPSIKPKLCARVAEIHASIPAFYRIISEPVPIPVYHLVQKLGLSRLGSSKSQGPFESMSIEVGPVWTQFSGANKKKKRAGLNLSKFNRL